MFSDFIVCASTNPIHKTKVFTHEGVLLNEFYPLENGRPYFASDTKLLILSREGRETEINLYDLALIDPACKEETKLPSQSRIMIRRDVEHFCGNEKIVVAFTRNFWSNDNKISIFSTETQSRAGTIETEPGQFSYTRMAQCVNYWFDIFEHQGQTYLATLSNTLTVWSIDDRRAHLAGNNSRDQIHEVVSEFQIRQSCRITVKAGSGVLAISSNDLHDLRLSNNLIYAIPFEVLIGNKEGGDIIQKVKFEDFTETVIHPICVFEDMVSSGLSISKTRIAILHSNGAISDLNYKQITNEQKLALYRENMAIASSAKTFEGDYLGNETNHRCFEAVAMAWLTDSKLASKVQDNEVRQKFDAMKEVDKFCKSPYHR